MFPLRLTLAVSLGVASAQAQDFRETPRLPLEQVLLSARLPKNLPLGTVSSIAADARGAIYVLQRGDQADPVIVINREGRVLRSWGKGMYTVPHSIRVDPEGNIWTVDAGSSVILKFSPEGNKLEEIRVGEVATGKDCAFPTLCGTTDITFAPGGRLFISDGYGNARILEYTAKGKRVRMWGSKGSGPGEFRIPHGIANDGQTLYVADRENARIQRFDFDGHYLGAWSHLGRPFALKTSGGFLWVAFMTAEAGRRPMPWIAKVDPATGKVLAQIESTGPHAIDVNQQQELFTTGCCGGASPSAFAWFRRVR